jgi:hypothetical protein
MQPGACSRSRPAGACSGSRHAADPGMHQACTTGLPSPRCAVTASAADATTAPAMSAAMADDGRPRRDGV